jgi:hypothetical protein
VNKFNYLFISKRFSLKTVIAKALNIQSFFSQWDCPDQDRQSQHSTSMKTASFRFNFKLIGYFDEFTVADIRLENWNFDGFVENSLVFGQNFFTIFESFHNFDSKYFRCWFEAKKEVFQS